MARSKREDSELSTRIRPSADGGGSTTPVFELTLTEGPDAGARFVIDGTGPGRLLLGTSPACAVRLSDALVSRRHAAFDHGDVRGLRLTDLDSTNGTFVNGLRTEGIFLRGGEEIRVGDTALRLVLVDAAQPVVTSSATGFGRMTGASPEMRRLYPILERLAASQVPIVIEGETGTGKEVLAESLHMMGPRADKPFIVFDCTTVAPSLVESELFGHEKGSFTGAAGPRKGVFELAHGGTLFIDEIGELELSLQPKLLRAIQSSEVRRVGSNQWIPVDVRVVAATRRDLDAEVQAGRFRDDLFYRLAVARIELPPLRDRRGDVALLAEHFWQELGGAGGSLPYDVLARCETYRWPGNVRELYNEISRRIALGDLEGAVRGARTSKAPPPEDDDGGGVLESILARDLPFPRARDAVLEEFQRRYLERVLERHGGSVTLAAAASGVALRYFQVLRSKSK